jgi:hypothetical protein
MTVVINGTTGYSGPVGVLGDLTTTGNTILGDQSTDTLNVANGNLVLNSSGNLGVGTASPSYKLDVQGASGVGIQLYETSTGNNNRLRITQTAGITNYLTTYSSGSTNAQTWSIGGSELMRLDSSGNLGLGVTSTNNTLGKTLQVGQAGAWVAESGTNRWWIGNNWYYNSGDKYINNGYATLYSQQNGTHTFFTAASGTAGNGISFTQAMTLNASGNLLVGTTTDSGNSLIREVSIKGPNGGNAHVFVTTNSGIRAQLGVTEFGGANVGFVGTTTSNPLLFQTNDTERARINSDGVFITANGMVTTTTQLMTGTVTTNGSGNAQIGISGWSWGEFNSYRRNIFVMLGIQGGTYLGTWAGVIQWAVSASTLGTTSTNGASGAGTITFVADGNTGGRWFQLTGVPASSSFSYVIRGFAVTEDYRSNYGAF